MIDTAFVFPGQGTQKVGMGLDLSSNFAEADLVFEEANSILNWDLRNLCFNGPIEDSSFKDARFQCFVFQVNSAEGGCAIQLINPAPTLPCNKKLGILFCIILYYKYIFNSAE